MKNSPPDGTATQPPRARFVRRSIATIVALILGITTLTVAPSASAANPVPVTYDMRMLVLNDGSPMTTAWIDYLDSEGVAHTDLDLNAGNREKITLDYLADWGTSSIKAKFYGVIAPNAAPSQLTQDELDALATYETSLSVRQLSIYNWANPTLGLNYSSYMGPVDGFRATVTDFGSSNGFTYLDGLTMDELDTGVTESYGYLAQPLADTDSMQFDPVVTTPIPGESNQGVLAGVLTQDGREQMIMTYAVNKNHSSFKILAPGLLNWVTRGISTTYYRNYFSVHIDDVLLPDDLWNTEANCTVGSIDCNVPNETSRMTADDVTYLENWQKANGMMLDMTYNAAGTVEYQNQNGSDPLASALLKEEWDFRWLSHTYTHDYIGCEQKYITEEEWYCVTDSAGNIKYASEKKILDEIRKNKKWGRKYYLSDFDGNAIVPGEHSGLKTLPQMTIDNPNLAPALEQTGIKWVASDASREPEQRSVANGVLTVPRYPMNIFYNAETVEQEVDEYNWIYNSVADGGSGKCEKYSATMTCIEPLDIATGFEDYIVPLEAQIAMSHVVANDPRPHYVHQSNLAGERILYPVLDTILATYQDNFSDSAPIVNPDMREAGEMLELKNTWNAQGSGITSTISGSTVALTNTTGSTFKAPLTVPEGSIKGNATYGESYGGQLSRWTKVKPGKTLTVTLPQGAGFPATAVRPSDTVDSEPVKTTTRNAPKEPTIEVLDELPSADDIAARETE